MMKDVFLVEYGTLQSGDPGGCQPGLHLKWDFLNEHSWHQPKQLRSDARVSIGYLACPSGHQPGLKNEEREEWVFVENADSLAAPAVTGQGASKKQSSQLSDESQGPSGRSAGQFEWFTRVGNLGELAQLQRSPARACVSKDSENSSS